MVARVVAVLIIALLAAPGAAHANPKPPKAAQAKAAADAWTKAMFKVGDKRDFSAVAPLTGDNFRVFVVREQPDEICDVTVADRAKLAEALECVHNSNAVLSPLKPWTKGDFKKLWGPLRERSSEITALAKTHALYLHYEDGEGIVTIAIIGVSLGADGKPHVSAVFASELYN